MKEITAKKLKEILNDSKNHSYTAYQDGRHVLDGEKIKIVDKEPKEEKPKDKKEPQKKGFFHRK